MTVALQRREVPNGAEIEASLDPGLRSVVEAPVLRHV